LEATRNGLKERIGDIFRRNNTIGFSSYGEQFHGIHNNFTFSGCAIGVNPEPDSGAHDV
jgi:hypothetical protein